MMVIDSGNKRSGCLFAVGEYLMSGTLC